MTRPYLILFACGAFLSLFRSSCAFLIAAAVFGTQAGAAITTSGGISPPFPVTMPDPWTIDGTLAVGGSADGTLSITDGSDVSNTSFAWLGLGSGATGTATIAGAGSTWTSNRLYVGNSGTGTLTVAAGGRVVDNSTIETSIGYHPSSSGVATVTGADSALTTSGSLYIGYRGTGTLTVAAGGSVSSFYGAIGSGAGSNGTAIVTGPDSTWTNSSTLTVGYNGTGALMIANGGSVSNSSGTIGAVSTGNGTVTVTGPDSTWTNSSTLTVGNNGTGALMIANGGSVSNTGGTIGTVSTGNGTVTVIGTGSEWSNSGTLSIAAGGSGTLTIMNGGIVSSYNAHVGLASGDGMVTVSGAGSEWNSSTVIVIGYTGGTGNVTVAAGGRVTSKGVDIGSLNNGRGSVIVTGDGSRWDNSNGGNGVYIGSFSASGEGSLEVSNGGIFSVDNSIHVGYAGSGVLTILSGGTVSNDSAAEIAALPGSSGTATITGAGSLWQTDLLYVGGTSSQVGGDGTLNISNGAIVNVADSLRTWAQGTVNLSGGRLKAPTLNVADGVFNMTGGRLVADSVIGDLTNSGGTLAPGDSAGATTITGNYTQQSDAALEIEIGGTLQGSEFDFLSVSGTASLDGTLAVSLISGFTPAVGQSFDILDWSYRSGSFSSIQLPPLAAGQWDTSQLYESGTLAVVSVLPGDFNEDGPIDAADYVAWRKTDNTPNGYSDWRTNFGVVAIGSSPTINANVPEPTLHMLLLSLIPAIIQGLRKRQCTASTQTTLGRLISFRTDHRADDCSTRASSPSPTAGCSSNRRLTAAGSTQRSDQLQAE